MWYLRGKKVDRRNMFTSRAARPLGRTFFQQSRKMGGGGPVPTEGIDGAVR